MFKKPTSFQAFYGTLKSEAMFEQKAIKYKILIF